MNTNTGFKEGPDDNCRRQLVLLLPECEDDSAYLNIYLHFMRPVDCCLSTVPLLYQPCFSLLLFPRVVEKQECPSSYELKSRTTKSNDECQAAVSLICCLDITAAASPVALFMCSAPVG